MPALSARISWILAAAFVAAGGIAFVTAPRGADRAPEITAPPLVRAPRIGFLVSLNLVNPDAEIALRNAQRFERTGRVDREYLRSLADDALPELLRARLVDASWRQDEPPEPWTAWNLSRMRARRLWLAEPAAIPK